MFVFGRHFYVGQRTSQPFIAGSYGVLPPLAMSACPDDDALKGLMHREGEGVMFGGILRGAGRQPDLFV